MAVASSLEATWLPAFWTETASETSLLHDIPCALERGTRTSSTVQLVTQRRRLASEDRTENVSKRGPHTLVPPNVM